ncbi:YidH family protein [Lysobacter soli]|uniref:YidH family protein n=1 Tax=Lysobacter soli TaxID=453783 RepID=UPI0037C905CD
MRHTKPMDIDPVAVPDAITEALTLDDGASRSTKLAIHRTNLATRRTGLADLRSHLANERTHLAYLRTAVSLIGFGITLNRFSVFLQQQGTVQTGGSGPLLRTSENVGLGMVVLGLALTGWAMYRYWHVDRDIKRGCFRSMNVGVMTLTVLFLFFGGLTALWLI